MTAGRAEGAVVTCRYPASAVRRLLVAVLAWTMLPLSPAFATSTAPAPGRLRAVLLGAGDLPAGVRLDAGADSYGDGARASITATSASCTRRQRALNKGVYDGRTVVHRGFSADPSRGPWFTEQIDGHLSARAAQRSLTEYASVLRQCPTITITTPGAAPLRIVYRPLAAPKLGDQAVAFRSTTVVDGTTVVADLVAVRSGRVVLSLTGTALRKPALAVLTTLSRRATAKAEHARVGR